MARLAYVDIGVEAKIIGAIYIGNDALIGGNSVVVKLSGRTCV